jgi:hypothetical protein
MVNEAVRIYSKFDTNGNVEGFENKNLLVEENNLLKYKKLSAKFVLKAKYNERINNCNS